MNYKYVGQVKHVIRFSDKLTNVFVSYLVFTFRIKRANHNDRELSSKIIYES